MKGYAVVGKAIVGGEPVVSIGSVYPDMQAAEHMVEIHMENANEYKIPWEWEVVEVSVYQDWSV